MASALSAGASAAIKYSIAILGRAPTDAELSSFAAAYKGASATASEDAVASAVAASTAGTTALKPGVFSATKQAQVILGNHGVTNDAVVAYVASMIDGTNADAGKVALPLGTVARVVANFFSSWTSTPSNPYNDVFMAGSTALKTASTAAESAILNPTPVVPPVSTATYTLTGPASVDEGKSAIVTLATKNVAAGSSVGYVISGVDATDVNSLVGSATVGVDGNAYIQIDAKADETTEGVETLTITAAGASASIKINDTSVLTPKALKYTTGVDDLTGGAADDSVSAIYSGTAGASTIAAGDAFNGGAGADTLSITMDSALGADTTLTPNVTSVETIVVKNLDADDHNLDLVQATGVTAVKTVGSVTGGRLDVVNAPLAVTYAVEATPISTNASAGITVSFNAIDIVGKADVANFSVKNAGSKVGVAASNPALLDIVNTTGVESMAVATTGTNYIAVSGGGTATKTLTITGDGVNEISISSDFNATLTTDASAATGAQTFAFAATVTSSDVIKGGASTSDVLSITQGTATGVTVSGVETLMLGQGSTAGSTLDFLADPTFKTVDVRESTNDLYLAGLKTGFTLAFTGADVTPGSPTLGLGNASNDTTFGLIQLNTAMAGTNDTLAVTLGNQGVAAASGYTASVKATGIENVTLTQSDINSNATTTFTYSGPGVKTLTASSSGNVAITLDARASSAPNSTATTASTDSGNLVTSVDLSTVAGTGALSFGQSKGVFAAAATFKTAQGGTTQTFGEESATDVITITGNKGVDSITTGSIGTFIAKLADGNDVFGAAAIGTAGNGTVNVDGEGGNDSITGGVNADTLAGGDGADTITGGRGADIIDGGSSSDVYIYSNGTASTTGTNQVSTLNFFGLGSGEYINVTINGVTYSTVWNGNAATTMSDFVSQHAGNIKAATGGANGIVVTAPGGNAVDLSFAAVGTYTDTNGVRSATGFSFTAPTGTVTAALNSGAKGGDVVANAIASWTVTPDGTFNASGDTFMLTVPTTTPTTATITFDTDVGQSLSNFTAANASVGGLAVINNGTTLTLVQTSSAPTASTTVLTPTSAAGAQTTSAAAIGAITNLTALTTNTGLGGTATGASAVAATSAALPSASHSSYLQTGSGTSVVITNAIDQLTYVTGDVIDLGSTAITVTSVAAAAGVSPAISSTGIVSFNAVPATLAVALDQVAAGIHASGTGTAAGEAAVFNFGGKTYLYISDAEQGHSAADVVIELVGVSTLTTGITLTSGGDIGGIG